MKKQSVTLTNGELVNCVNTLNMLLESKPTLGILQGFPLAQNVRVMQPEAAEVWQARNGIVEKYTKKGEDGQPLTNGARYVFETPEEEVTAATEMNDLNAIQTELSLYRLSFDSFLVFGEQPHWIWDTLEPIIDLEV